MARKLTRRRISERCWMFLCIALAAACSPASPVIPSMFATEPSPAADAAAALLKPAAAPVADLRAASPVADSEGLAGSWGWILAIIILAGVIGVVASDGDEAVSP